MVNIEEYLLFIEPHQRPKLLEEVCEIGFQISSGEASKGLGRTIALLQVEKHFDKIFPMIVRCFSLMTMDFFFLHFFSLKVYFSVSSTFSHPRFISWVIKIVRETIFLF